MMLSACSWSPSQTGSGLVWQDGRMEGASFALRETDAFTIHYPAPVTPEQAEAFLLDGAVAVPLSRSLGRLLPHQKVELWLVPPEAPWPAGLPQPPRGRTARAVAPRTVVARAGYMDGFREAIAVATTQPEGSPAFAVDWLHEGTGAIAAQGWDLFPTSRGNLKPADALAALENPAAADVKTYRAAAAGLAALLMDRWGVLWERHWQKRPEELTPEKALVWASGQELPTYALRYWEERLAYLGAPETRGESGMLAGQSNWVRTAADMSPVRLNPQLERLPKGPGPNDNYSPHSYDIDVRYTPEERTVAGKLTLQWQNGESIPVDALYFNLWVNAEQFAIYGASITVDHVLVDGKPSPYEARYMDLAVPLGQVVAPGESATVEIGFTTILPALITGRDLGQDESGRFNLTHWFPSLVVLDDRGWVMHALSTGYAEPYAEVADWRVRLDVPSGTVIGATGHRVKRENNGERWAYQYEGAGFRDFVVTGGLGLMELQRVVDGVTVHLIDQNPDWLGRVADEVEQAMQVYNQHFGPYPYQDLVVACCQGMEWPGLMFTVGLPQKPDQEESFRYVTHHELAHQWFYGVVGNDQYHEPWLDEGFATYADRISFRTRGWAPHGGDPKQRQMPPGLHVSHSQYYFQQSRQMWVAYYKGAQTLEDLQALVGDATMDRLMHEWYRRFQFKTATTADFIRVAEEITGRDLEAFFADHRVYATDRGPYRPLFPLGRATPEDPL